MATGDQPRYRAYAVEDVKGSAKAAWTEIGAAWPHKDGKGLSVRLRALPVNNHIELRDVAERPEGDHPQLSDAPSPR
jgi:hypothetical protein